MTQKVHRVEVAVAYFMNPKVTLTFVVGVTFFMTPKGHRVGNLIRGRSDLLYDPNGHGDLCGRFDLVYDLKGHRAIRGRLDSLKFLY